VVAFERDMAHRERRPVMVGLEKPTATVKSIDPTASMDQPGSDYVLAVRVLHAGLIIMTHAVSDQ
jgi:hypothetical protein